MKGIWLVSLALSACSLEWGLTVAEAADAQTEFVGALADVERVKRLTDADDSAGLRAYVLYDYLIAARVVARLGDPGQRDTAMLDARSFFERTKDEPVAFAARRDAMAVLTRATAWHEFLALYSPDAANVSRECDYLRARVELGETEGLAPLIRQRWLTPARLPPACETAFQWLRDQGVLDDVMTAQRVALLLEQDEPEFARIIARRLDAPLASRYLQWADMIESPLTTLTAIADGDAEPAEPDAVFAAWNKLTTRAPAESFDLFPRLRRRLDLDARASSRFARALALGLAWDRREDAMRAFARVGRDELDDYALEWLTRAAIWNGEWHAASDAVAAMSEEARSRSAWRYWEARSAEAIGESAASASAYASLADEDNFYGALAAARLDIPVTPHSNTLARNEPIIDRLAGLPAFLRARELLALGMRNDATREWRYGTAQLSVPELAQAVVLANRWGWHDMAVATATQAGIFDEYALLYPQAYSPQVAEAAKATMFAPALVRGLLRQESLFRPDAVSEAGAVGLAQLLPATARRSFDVLPPELRTDPDLLDPLVNVLLGAATLRSFVDTFDGQTAVGLAAYNAGPNAAARWLPERAVDLDVWIENIPYNETRQYVRQVLWHSVVYAWQETGRPQRVDSWLGQIAPRPRR